MTRAPATRARRGAQERQRERLHGDLPRSGEGARTTRPCGGPKVKRNSEVVKLEGPERRGVIVWVRQPISSAHSQAAPRTPLESPWRLGSRRVTTVSENT